MCSEITDSGPQPQAEANLASWHDVMELYKELTSYPHWQQVVPLCELTYQFMTSERGRRFRAGTSVAALIISTADHHGLAPGKPFVRVESRDRYGSPRFEVSYRDVTAGQPAESRTCGAADLRPTVEAMLDRLWLDTRGSAREPEREPGH